MPGRASKFLSGIGFDQVMQAGFTNWFSGGWRIISLAQWFMLPKLLLLRRADQPIHVVVFLEEYMCSRWENMMVQRSQEVWEQSVCYGW
jgi:hypothetical protein